MNDITEVTLTFIQGHTIRHHTMYIYQIFDILVKWILCQKISFKIHHNLELSLMMIPMITTQPKELSRSEQRNNHRHTKGAIQSQTWTAWIFCFLFRIQQHHFYYYSSELPYIINNDVHILSVVPLPFFDQNCRKWTAWMKLKEAKKIDKATDFVMFWKFPCHFGITIRNSYADTKSHT